MNATTEARPIRVTAMAALLQGVGGGLGWSLLPATMPMVARDLGISHAMGGLVWGAASLGIAIAAPFGGAAVDRLGPRRVAGLAMLAGAAACAARVLATGPYSLAVAMLAFGLHIGFVAPAIPKALAGHVAATRLARANGTAVLAYTLATAACILVAPLVLVPVLGGWRPLMLVAAAAMALTGVAWLTLVADRGQPAPHARVTDGLRLLRDPAMRRVAAMHFLLFGGYLALLGLLPRALTEAGLAPLAVGIAVASWLTAAGLANFAGPWISDRLGRRRPVILVGALVAAAGLAAFALHTDAPALLVVAALGGGSFAPLLLVLPFELPGVGPARAGAALGLLMLVGQAGGFLLPILGGTALEHGSLAASIGLLALVHLAIVLPALGMRETGARGPTAAPAAAPCELPRAVV